MGTMRALNTELRLASSAPRSPICSKPGIDGLLLELVVNLFGAFALEDHRRNPRWPVPGGEIGNGGVAGQSENVVPFLDAAGMIGKDLAHEDAGVPVVDADGDLHLFERENRRIGLLLVARDENAGVGRTAASKPAAR